MFEVRCAAVGDEEPLMELLRQMHRENGMATLDENKVRAIVQRLIHRQGGVIGVIRGRNCIEASCGMVLSQWWYSQDHQLEDLWNFVAEPYRRSNHAKDLIEWAKHYAEEIGIPLLMGVLSVQQTAAKVRLYERRLGKPAGAIFVFNGKLPAPAA